MRCPKCNVMSMRPGSRLGWLFCDWCWYQQQDPRVDWTVLPQDDC